jgi:hypothetical protein
LRHLFGCSQRVVSRVSGFDLSSGCVGGGTRTARLVNLP